MNGGKLLSDSFKQARLIVINLFSGRNLNNNELRGKFGEKMAKKFLCQKGYSFLEQNWRSRKNQRLEIDLIFQDEEILVFVEVRARSSKSLVTGYDSINRKKLSALKRSFNSYLRESSKKFPHYRFDVVEIDLPTDKSFKPSIFHHENIAIF